MRPLHKVQQNGGRKAKVLGRKLQNSVTPARRAPCSLAGHNFGQPSSLVPLSCPSPTYHKCIFKYPTAAKLSCIFAVFMRLLTRFSLSFLLSLADGDENKENLCGRPLGPHHAGGCQKLLRTVWSGEYNPFSLYLYIYFSGNLYISAYIAYICQCRFSCLTTCKIIGTANHASCCRVCSAPPSPPAHCTPACSS